MLRDATPADALALSRLAIDAFVAKFGSMYRPEDLAAFLDHALSPAAFAADLANPARQLHVVDEGGALRAYAKLGLTAGFPEHARGQRVIELKQLYTAPDATGGGLGARLMDWALAVAAARGCDEMQLSVFSENFGAQRFYRRYGFEKVADVTFAVGAHTDHEFLFAKWLDGG